jgi:hypothetical protein
MVKVELLVLSDKTIATLCAIPPTNRALPGGGVHNFYKVLGIYFDENVPIPVEA